MHPKYLFKGRFVVAGRMHFSAIFLLGCLASANAAAPKYKLQAVGPNDRNAAVIDINDRGDVLLRLYSETDPPTVTDLVWLPKGQSQVNLSQVFPLGAAQNNHGVLLGPVQTPQGERVLRRFERGSARDLFNVPNDLYLSGFNDKEDFALTRFAGPGASAFVGHTSSSRLHDLGDLGAPTTVAFAMNELGAITGASRTGAQPEEIANGSTFQESFVYQAGSLNGIGVYDGVASTGFGINNLGQVVGETTTEAGGSSRAFFYDPVTGIDVLALEGQASVAKGINDKSVIVGTTIDENGTHRAFVSDGMLRSELLQDVSIGGQAWASLSRATGINNNGQIVGIGLLDGRRRAFVATPVPEPALAIAAVIVVAVLSANRNKRQAFP